MLSQSGEILTAISDYFRRILVQLKSPWLLYQLDFMAAFERFLNAGVPNNKMLMGLNSGETA